MKKDIHPQYRFVVFQDAAAKFSFLTRSTLKTEKTIQWTDGKTYPLVNLEISSASHPFYTGQQKLLDTAGRVERFQKRFSKTEGKTVVAKKKKASAKKEAPAAKKVARILRNVPRVAAPEKKARAKKD